MKYLFDGLAARLAFPPFSLEMVYKMLNGWKLHNS